MSNVATETDHQNCLNAHFEASSAYWTNIYEFEDVDGTIYRQRTKQSAKWCGSFDLADT
jgi:hypothetical protein